MRNSVRLFPGSVVAVLLGVLLAAPLLYSTIVTAIAMTMFLLEGLSLPKKNKHRIIVCFICMSAYSTRADNTRGNMFETETSVQARASSGASFGVQK